ncbi:nucleoside hydrolase [Ascodesmis nigricans]|uniref:Nucleoside hydrolase n=1 Tax=Ascodesmis nigricans TaxID=341454 RepID=A0A4S2MNV3_9PEZI|nr:nucleoside hydrolase [Ascodesmis nigricans]
MPPQKIVIDTDPGVDDVFALLLALASSPEELELELISLTFGNIDVENCLRNVVSMFHVLDRERIWRIETGREPGFKALDACRPIVAVGADGPLEGVIHEYDYFHGKDGLGNVTTKAPHFTPTETWKHLFTQPTESISAHSPPPTTTATPSEPTSPFVTLPANFRPSARPAHIEILDLLRRNPPNTITIIAVGPLTNLALAAAEDLPTFLLAKSIVIMGGALSVPGNVTPLSEFNHWSCAYSAAQIYAYTSPRPYSTLPPGKVRDGWEKERVLKEEERVKLTVAMLDLTTRCRLRWGDVESVVKPLAEVGSPLASWILVFAESTFGHIEGVYESELDLALHDPVCVAYVLDRGKGEVARSAATSKSSGTRNTQSSTTSKETEPAADASGWAITRNLDIRVEAEGQWTRGMCVIDRRGKRAVSEEEAETLEHDRGGWLHRGLGNRVDVLVGAKSREEEEGFGRSVLEVIFKC